MQDQGHRDREPTRGGHWNPPQCPEQPFCHAPMSSIARARKPPGDLQVIVSFESGSRWTRGAEHGQREESTRHTSRGAEALALIDHHRLLPDTEPQRLRTFHPSASRRTRRPDRNSRSSRQPGLGLIVGPPAVGICGPFAPTDPRTGLSRRGGLSKTRVPCFRFIAQELEEAEPQGLASGRSKSGRKGGPSGPGGSAPVHPYPPALP